MGLALLKDDYDSNVAGQLRAMVAKLPGASFDSNGEWSTVTCPTAHKHEGGVDKNPSCRINLNEGYYKCWVCGNKGGWNRLAEQTGLPKLDFLQSESQSDYFYLPLMEGIEEEGSKKSMQEIDSYLKDAQWMDIENPWMSLSVETLEWFGCKRALIKFKKGFQTFIVIPVHLGGEVKGVMRRDITGRGKYLNTSNKDAGDSWVTTDGLLGHDEAIQMDEFQENGVLFVVEGVRDAMKCQQAGIPAIAILGTENWSEHKFDHIMRLKPEKIGLLFDGDAPGHESAKKIEEQFSESYIPDETLVRYDIPIQRPKLDPAAYSEEMLWSIYEDCLKS